MTWYSSLLTSCSLEQSLSHDFVFVLNYRVLKRTTWNGELLLRKAVTRLGSLPAYEGTHDSCHDSWLCIDLQGVTWWVVGTGSPSGTRLAVSRSCLPAGRPMRMGLMSRAHELTCDQSKCAIPLQGRCFVLFWLQGRRVSELWITFGQNIFQIKCIFKQSLHILS